MTTAKNTVATIIPSLHYRDAPAMIEWLCRAFGFEKHAVYEDGKGGIAHAQLRFGNGMIMLSSVSDTQWGRLMVQPADISGRESQLACVIVANPAAHYAQAVAAGAEIIDALAARDYGGSSYGCRDPEGHIWNFGDYDPWVADAG